MEKAPTGAFSYMERVKGIEPIVFTASKSLINKAILTKEAANG